MASRNAYFGLGGLNGAYGNSSPYYGGASGAIDTPTAVAHGLGFGGMHSLGGGTSHGGGFTGMRSTGAFHQGYRTSGGPGGSGPRAGFVQPGHTPYRDVRHGTQQVAGFKRDQIKPFGFLAPGSKSGGRGGPAVVAAGPRSRNDSFQQQPEGVEEPSSYKLSDVRTVPSKQSFSMPLSAIEGSKMPALEGEPAMKALPPGSTSRTLGASSAGYTDPAQDLMAIPRVGSALPSTRAPRSRRSSFNPNQGSLF